MKRNEEISDERIKKKHFPIIVFIITFVVLGILTTIQMKIVGKYINYKEISKEYVIAVACYWLIASALFTVFINLQIRNAYVKPMKRIAEACKKVADGDFSVYIPPMHRTDKRDYLDVMFLDFNKMVEELGSIETLKTDFISNVSHEIKTPIAIIQNYAEAIQMDNLTPEQKKEYAMTIKESAKRLSELISNILKLNKMENQRIQPVTESYDICRQLGECALHFEDIWEKKDIEFIADIEDRAIIMADESLMELVWNNMLSNAIKFTEPGGRVSLTQTSTEDEIIVSISDTGCGMSEETMNHIFDKFYQGDTSHSTEGNGLGLALVLRVLQLTESSITVNSTQGKGTVFEIRVPIKVEKKGDYNE